MEKKNKIILLGALVLILGLIALPSLIGNLWFQLHPNEGYCTSVYGEPVGCNYRSTLAIWYIGIKTYLVFMLSLSFTIVSIKSIKYFKVKEELKVTAIIGWLLMMLLLINLVFMWV